MPKWSDRVTYQGKPLNRGTLEIMKAANIILQNSPYYGKEKSDVTLVQGSYNRGGVSQSAGTHDGGGAIDVTAFNITNRVKVYRLLGVAFWDRKTLPGVWSRHGHGIVVGDGTASRGGLSQVTDYRNNRNGLANRGRDDGFRPAVLPIMAVAPWTERGKKGVRYTTKAYTMRSQPTNKSSSRGSIKSGEVFTVILVVNAGGTLWAVNKNGNFLPASVLTTKKPAAPKPTPKPTAYVREYVISKDGVKGYESYNRSSKVKGSPDKGQRFKSDQISPDRKFLRSVTSKLWYHVDDLDLYVAPPPVAFTMNVGTLNVIRWRITPDGKSYKAATGGTIQDVKKGLSYEDRLPHLAKTRDAMKASVFGTQEAGRYVDADALDKAMGGGWDNRLHGDAGDLCNAIHTHLEKRYEEEGGRFNTAGTHHNWATWCLLRDKASKVLTLVVDTHTDHRARGTKAASAYDLHREKQVDALIEKATELAKALRVKYKVADIPIVFVGDFNSDKDDAYDGPGRAMAAAGYVDCETIAAKKSGPETTYNGLNSKTVTGRRLDRIFVKRGTPCKELVTVGGYPGTDHNGVRASLTFDNK